MQTVEIEEVWITEPRWTWFGTPLWRQPAVRLEIQYVDLTSFSGNHPMFNVGNSMSSFSGKSRANIEIEYHWIYFTHEEHVMFKLMNVEMNSEKLQQGIIYS